MKATKLWSVLVFVLCVNAWGAKFKQPEFELSAQVGQAFSLDLNTLVEAEGSLDQIRWAFNTLPKWLSFDGKHTLAGTPSGDAISDIISVLASEAGSGDEAKLRLEILPETTTPIKWASEKLSFSVCLGSSLASDDLAVWVMISDPGPFLPIPLVKFELVGAPAWVVPIYKVPPGSTLASFYLTGTPPAPGDFAFKVRARFRETTADIDAIVSVEPCL